MPLIALVTKIPWFWQAATAFGIGWFGGWPGEAEDEGESTTDTLITLLWVGLGAAVAVFAVRRLGED